jgi:ribose-phosphate pyrophosphokinase
MNNSFKNIFENCDISNARIISGSSHYELAYEISNLTKVKMIEVENQYFSNGEYRPIIKESIRGKDIYLIQTGTLNSINFNRSVNDYIMELFLLAKTISRSDAASITLVIPNYPYARQDKKDNPRGSISAKDIAELIQLAGISRIICMELHAAQIQGFFDIPCDNLYCHHLIVDYLYQNIFSQEEINNRRENCVVISPDEGALKKARNFAGLLEVPLMVLSKQRDYTKLNIVEKTEIIGDKDMLKNRTAIIIDDMCDTFGTIQNATNLLVENGVKDVILCVTHGIFSGPAITRMNETEKIRCILCSNSIPQKENMKLCPKLQMFSISNLLSSVILRLICGYSVSSLFN